MAADQTEMTHPAAERRGCNLSRSKCVRAALNAQAVRQARMSMVSPEWHPDKQCRAERVAEEGRDRIEGQGPQLAGQLID